MSDVTQVGPDGKRHPVDKIDKVRDDAAAEREKRDAEVQKLADERTKQRVEERAGTSDRYLTADEAAKVDDDAFDVQATNAYENKPKLDPDREPVEFELDKSFTAATGDEPGRRGGGNVDAGGGVLSRTPRAATTPSDGPVEEAGSGEKAAPQVGQETDAGKAQAGQRQQATKAPKDDQFPKATGGGWYELSDGSKVQGEDEAVEAQSKL